MPKKSSGKIERAQQGNNPTAADVTDSGAKTSLSVTGICDRLVGLQRKRVMCIKQQSRACRAIESLIVESLGAGMLPKGQREPAFARAKKIRLAFETGTKAGDVASEDLDDLRPVVLTAAAGRAVFDKYLEDTLAEMATLAKLLPVWPWVKKIRGANARGLAAIVGEAGGDIGRFASPDKLKRYLSIGLVDTLGDGEFARQGNWGKGAAAEEIKAHHYNRERRAQVWQFLDYGLRLANVRNVKDAKGKPTGAQRALGPYGEMYIRKRAQYLSQGWGKTADGKEGSRANKAATRYIASKFLVRLWRAWRRATQGPLLEGAKCNAPAPAATGEQSSDREAGKRFRASPEALCAAPASRTSLSRAARSYAPDRASDRAPRETKPNVLTACT